MAWYPHNLKLVYVNSLTRLFDTRDEIIILTFNNRFSEGKKNRPIVGKAPGSKAATVEQFESRGSVFADARSGTSERRAKEKDQRTGGRNRRRQRVSHP